MKKSYIVHPALLMLTSFAALGSTSRCEDELKDNVADGGSSDSDSGAGAPIQETPDPVPVPDSDPAPVEPQYSLTKVMSNGTGCGGADAALITLDDKQQALKLVFPGFVAESGPGIDVTQSRKNCVITISASVPNGYQYAIKSIDYQGFVSVEENISMVHSTSLFFEGQGRTENYANDRTGPYTDGYRVIDNLGMASTWSPCGVSRALNINTSLRLKRDDNAADVATGLAAMDEINITFQMRKC